MKLRRMVEDKKCCGMRYYRLRCFFSSDRVESATHRHYWKMQDRASHNATRRRCRTAPLENFPFRLNYRLDEWKSEKEGGEKKEEQGETERKRERERKKVAYTHTLNTCTLRDLGNGKWERGEEIMISKRYRVPYVPPKDYPLNLGLISGEEKKEKEKRKKNDTMIRIIAMIDDVWLTVEQRAGSGIRI